MKRILLVAIVLLAGCAAAVGLMGMPPEARRKTPPPGIEGALDEGAPAPAIRAPSTTGEFSLDAARATGPVVLVFYRGHW